MLSAFFTYLLEASFSLAAFALAYRFLFSRLTYFQWNRWYLIGSMLLSMLIPFLPLGFLSNNSGALAPIQEAINLNLAESAPDLPPQSSSSSLQEVPAETSFPLSLLAAVLLGIYLIGCCFKAWELQRQLKKVISLIRQNPKVEKEGYYLVRTQENLPAFSFMHYIFLPVENKHLDMEDKSQILQHEEVHVAQKHSWDLLLFELAGIILWFNPLIYYFKSSIREVHEYLVDSTVTRKNKNVRRYGELLIKLASQKASGPILNTFSNKQIIHRIKMLTQTPSNPMEKLKFLFTIPLISLTLLLCSFLGNDPKPSKANPSAVKSEKFTAEAQEVTIRKISWLGNSAFTDAALNEALGLQEGDLYEKEDFQNRLNYNPDGRDLSALYMDNGYLFFHVTPNEVFVDNAVDIALTISEGPKVKVGKIIIKGNKEVSTAQILEKIDFQKGDLFSRAKLISSQKAIAQMGSFNQETVQINPVPYQKAEADGGEWIVDLEFVVEEN